MIVLLLRVSLMSLLLCSPHSYVFQPENAMPIGTFIDEKDDVELLDILPILLELQNASVAAALSWPTQCCSVKHGMHGCCHSCKHSRSLNVLRLTMQVEDVRDHLIPKVAALHAKQRAAAAAAAANNSRRQL
jgi:NLI interacting factor-like phosphatase